MHQVHEFDTFLNSEYNEIGSRALDVLATDGIKAPPIRISDDPRVSLDTHFPLPQALTEAVGRKILTPLKSIFDEIGIEQVLITDQWKAHLTFFIIFAAEADNRLSDYPEETVRPYQDLLQTTIEGLPPLSIGFPRVFPFSGEYGGIAIGGIMTDDRVNKSRIKFEDILNKKGLPYYNRYSPRILHSTVARWDRDVPPSSLGRLIQFLHDSDHTWDRSEYTIEFLDIATGGYNMRRDNVTEIARFPLSGVRPQHQPADS